jgi:hypothetical protein
MVDKNKEKTEWELHRNVVNICIDCSEKMKKDWQKKNKKIKAKMRVGDYVKLAITDKNGTEHLWFEIITINNVCPTCKGEDTYESSLRELDGYTHRCNGCGDYFSEFLGRCSNVPVVIEELKENDIKPFKFKDIENYMRERK